METSDGSLYLGEPVNLWGMPNLPSLIIFDLDGTLIDSLENIAASLNHMRGEFRLPPLSLEEVKRAVGKGARNLVTRTMPDNDRRIDEALAIYLEHNGRTLAVHTKLYPGAEELLSDLHQTGIPLALVTNKNTAHSELLLSFLGVSHYFHTILGCDAVKNCKPAPDPLLEALSRTGAKTETAVMVGDSSNDFDAARAAGIRTIGCRYGYGESWELERASVCIDSLKNLLPLPWSRWN